MLPLVFYVFIDVIAFSSVIIAVLPYHVMFLGAGPLVVTLYMSTFSFVQFFASPYIGRLSDKFGRKPIVLLGILLFTIASYLCANADDIHTLLLCRVAQATGACSTLVISRAIIRNFMKY